MRLLIVEDEADLARPLAKSLEKEGYAVDWVEDGKNGLIQARVNDYDCILLDLNLPEMDGLEVATRLREARKLTPIIMLTARSQVFNKLEGFESGADDYVTKPFDLRELMARVRAVVKRKSPNQEEKLSFGQYELVPEQNMVIRDEGPKNREIELSNKETALLEYLIRNRGQIVSTEDILEHVWDAEIDLFTDTVKTHIKTLRKKIDQGKKLIKTVRGKGYMVKGQASP